MGCQRAVVAGGRGEDLNQTIPFYDRQDKIFRNPLPPTRTQSGPSFGVEPTSAGLCRPVYRPLARRKRVRKHGPGERLDPKLPDNRGGKGHGGVAANSRPGSRQRGLKSGLRSAPGVYPGRRGFPDRARRLPGGGEQPLRGDLFRQSRRCAVGKPVDPLDVRHGGLSRRIAGQSLLRRLHRQSGGHYDRPRPPGHQAPARGIGGDLPDGAGAPLRAQGPADRGPGRRRHPKRAAGPPFSHGRRRASLSGGAGQSRRAAALPRSRLRRHDRHRRDGSSGR